MQGLDFVVNSIPNSSNMKKTEVLMIKQTKFEYSKVLTSVWVFCKMKIQKSLSSKCQVATQVDSIIDLSQVSRLKSTQQSTWSNLWSEVAHPSRLQHRLQWSRTTKSTSPSTSSGILKTGSFQESSRTRKSTPTCDLGQVANRSRL